MHQRALAADVNDELFRDLTDLGYGIYLNESGFHKQTVAKMSALITRLDKTHPQIATGVKPGEIATGSGSTTSAPGETQANENGSFPIPLLRTDIKCGDTYRQLYAEALELRALSRFHLKQRDPAIADLGRAIKLCPEHAYLHSSLGSLQFKMKRSKEALKELTKAVSLNANVRDAYFARASCNQQLGKRKDAQADLSKAKRLKIDQQKKLDSLTDKLDNLVKENKIDEALSVDLQLLDGFPRDVYVIKGYADRLSALGKNKEALRYASLAIMLDPTYAGGYRCRSRIHALMEKPELELADANRAFAMEPRSIDALNGRALANLDMDRPNQAIRDFDLLLKRTPDFADAYINRSTAYLRVGRYEDAVKDARKAYNLIPDSPYGYQALGAALRRSGAFNDSKKALEESFRYNHKATPDSIAMTQLNLAAVLTELKDPTANEHLDAAIKLAPRLAYVLLQRGTYDADPGTLDQGLRVLTKANSRRGSSLISPLHSKVKGTNKPDQRTGSNSTPSTPITPSTPPKRLPQPSKITTHRNWLPSHPGLVAVNNYIRVSKTDLQDCVIVTSRLIEKAPEQPDAFYIRGTANFCLGKYEAAAQDFKAFARLVSSKDGGATGTRKLDAERAGVIAQLAHFRAANASLPSLPKLEPDELRDLIKEVGTKYLKSVSP
jgi:tetratricopeptide (TPR) repeat protein